MNKLFFAGLAMWASMANVFAQSPWTKEKGKGYAQVGYNTILPTNVFFSNNTEQKYTNRLVYDNNIQAFGEYGITDKLTVIAAVNAKYVATGDIVDIPSDALAEERPPALVLPAGQKFGLGNSYISAKYRLYNKGWVVSAQGDVMLPSAKPDTVTFLATGFDAWGFAPSVSVGNAGNKWYAFANAGVNFRTGAFSHEWAATAEYGYKIKSVYLIANLHARYSLNNQPSPDFLHTGLSVNQQNYLAFGLKAFIPFTENLGINLSAFGAALSNNVQSAPSFGASVFYKW